MQKYKVIIWGTGMIGEYALRYTLANEHLELVGVKCFTKSKEGMDARDLSGTKGEATNVKATRDAEALLALNADCVIFAPRDALADPTIPGSPSAAWVPDLEALLKSGKNVIGTIMSAAHWRHYANGEQHYHALNDACMVGESTLFFTGIDPGFTPDAIAYALSSIVGQIDQIKTWEVMDYGPYGVHGPLRAMGFGRRPEDLPANAMDAVRISWGGVPYLLADAFGVTVEDVRVEGDVRLAERAFRAEGGLFIEKGTIEALNFRVIGRAVGRDLFIVNHVTRMSQESAPDWRRIGRDGGYAIEIDGHPPFRGEFPFGWPEGTGASWSDGMAMTSARCINSIEVVVNASPGYKTFLQLPPLGGRYAIRARREDT
jgi:hypothetical protein